MRLALRRQSMYAACFVLVAFRRSYCTCPGGLGGGAGDVITEPSVAMALRPSETNEVQLPGGTFLDSRWDLRMLVASLDSRLPRYRSISRVEKLPFPAASSAEPSFATETEEPQKTEILLSLSLPLPLLLPLSLWCVPAGATKHFKVLLLPLPPPSLSLSLQTEG